MKWFFVVGFAFGGGWILGCSKAGDTGARDGGADSDSDGDSDSDVDSDTDADGDTDTHPGPAPEGSDGFWGYVYYEDAPGDEPLEGNSVCVTSGSNDYGCVETNEDGLYAVDDLPPFPAGCNLTVNTTSELTGFSYSGGAWDLQTQAGDWLRADIPLFLDQG